MSGMLALDAVKAEFLSDDMRNRYPDLVRFVEDFETLVNSVPGESAKRNDTCRLNAV